MIQIKSILIAVLLVVFVSSVESQTRKDWVVTVKDIEVRNNVRSPDAPTPIDNKRSSGQRKWAVVFVDYKVDFPNKKASKTGLDDGLWLDKLSVQWDFLYKPAKAPNKLNNYIRFEKEVNYVNVKAGEHTALMFFDPVILERYFDKGKSIQKDIKIRFSIKANGYKESKGTLFYSEGKMLKSVKDMQSLNKAFEFDGFKSMNNIIMDRSESPFRNIQYDLFNTIVPKD